MRPSGLKLAYPISSAGPYTQNFRSGPGIPERSIAVLPRCQYPVAFRVKNGRWKIADRPKHKKLLSRGGVPDARGAVSGGCNDTASVRTEIGSLHRSLMALQNCYLGTVRDVPYACGLVVGRSDDAIAGPVESCIRHSGVVTENCGLMVR